MTKRLKRFLRPLVSRTISPKLVQRLRFQWWYLSSYFPSRVSSRFLKRTPKIRYFGPSGILSNIEDRLQAVNLLAPTEMCRVMADFGSDKAKNRYTPVYSALFNDRRGLPLCIFELGLGSNNLNVLSNMGVFGAPGASLRGWRQLFPHALVYGADIDRRILFEEDRIKTFYCDQLEAASIREMWSHADLRGGADIIIEDGLHTFEANISFLQESLEHLCPGGIYVVEDIAWEDFEKWYEVIDKVYSKEYPKHEFAFLALADHGYNNVLVIRRPAGEAVFSGPTATGAFREAK